MLSLFAKKKYFRIGVAGYSSKFFNKKEAKELLLKSIKKALKHNKNDYPVAIVSGLTDIGVPSVAYNLAVEEGYRTVGYACAKAKDFVCFDVDEEHIVGKSWGDESEEFLNNIDALISVGGGKQTAEELKKAEEKGLPTFENQLAVEQSLCLMGYVDLKQAKELKQVLAPKGVSVHNPDEYHITIRYWSVDVDSLKAHTKKVIEYVEERFAHPQAFEVEFDGETNVWGNEKSHVLTLKPSLLNQFQAEVDKALQDMGAPPSDFADYRPHITIGEQLETKLKPPKDLRLLINKWKLTSKIDRDTESTVIWESEKQYKTAARKVIASFNQLSSATNVDDVLDFLVFRCPAKVVNATVFDHLLLSFFSRLPDFDSRNDFSEEELEEFKQNIPYEALDLDRFDTMKLIKGSRSVNRVLDQLVECLSEAKRKELARDHIKQFWLEKMYQGDLKKFISGLKEEFWTSES